MREASKSTIIGRILKCSIVIHAIYLALFILLITTQDFYMGQFLGQSYQFVFPAAAFFFAIARFGLHVTLGMYIVHQIRKKDMRRIAEFIGLIYFSIGFVMGYRIGDVITKLSIGAWQISPQYMVCYNGLGIFLSWIGFLLNLAMFLFLIGCAMSWYYKKYSLVEGTSDIQVNEVIE